MRSLIKPPIGMAIAQVDYGGQEVGIAAALSGDPALRALAKGLQDASKAAYQNNGEVHVVIFDPPPGYEPCRGRIDWKTASLTGETTFSGAIGEYSGQLKFGVNAVVPRHRPSGQWVHAMVYLQSVPKGTRQENGCWPTKKDFWVCRDGKRNCNFYPGAKLSDQANYR